MINTEFLHVVDILNCFMKFPIVAHLHCAQHSVVGVGYCDESNDTDSNGNRVPKNLLWGVHLRNPRLVRLSQQTNRLRHILQWSRNALCNRVHAVFNGSFGTLDNSSKKARTCFFIQTFFLLVLPFLLHFRWLHCYPPLILYPI